MTTEEEFVKALKIKCAEMGVSMDKFLSDLGLDRQKFYRWANEGFPKSVKDYITIRTAIEKSSDNE